MNVVWLSYLYKLGMIVDILLFVLGVVLIIAGANFLTEGAASLARRMGLSSLMVGLTVVAFGTSAPELVVSLTSALKGSADIAVGNVVGSNIFNVLAIVGITALVKPLTITQSTIKKEIPLLVLASLVLSVMVWDSLMDAPLARANVITRGEGLVLLAFFVVFLAYTFSIASSPKDVSVADEVAADQVATRPIWLTLIFVFGGLGGLIFGGDLFVSSSSAIARSLGVSEGIIGLTLVAMGTSLPELATSVVAALKKEPELAVGNVVGSGLFNIFLILGLTSTISPISVVGITLMDFAVMLGSAILLYFFGVFFGHRTITRTEGTILTLLFIAYNTYLITSI